MLKSMGSLNYTKYELIIRAICLHNNSYYLHFSVIDSLQAPVQHYASFSVIARQRGRGGARS